MKKVSVVLILLLLPLFVEAAELPKIPKDCFDRDFYCSRSEVKRDASGQKMVIVKFFATLVGENFRDHEDVVNLFTDFGKWPDYTDGADEIDFVSSRTISRRVLAGKRVFQHYARYFMNAPWPVNRIEIVEQSTYKELSPAPGALTTWSFKTDRDFNLGGVKRKDGFLFLSYSAERKEYMVRVVMEVVPDTTFLKIASKHIQAGLTRLFLGMFELQ